MSGNKHLWPLTLITTRVVKSHTMIYLQVLSSPKQFLVPAFSVKFPSPLRIQPMSNKEMSGNYHLNEHGCFMFSLGLLPLINYRCSSKQLFCVDDPGRTASQPLFLFGVQVFSTIKFGRDPECSSQRRPPGSNVFFPPVHLDLLLTMANKNGSK